MAEKNKFKLNSIVVNTIKGILPLIKGQIGEIDEYLSAYLSEIELHEGEIRAAVLCSIGKGSEGGERAYLITCALDADDKPVRIIGRMLVSEFITQLISKL